MGHHGDVIVVGDRPVGKWPFARLECDSSYADDMLMVGREWLRKYALSEGYDTMLWQGMDCYWPDELSFEITRESLDEYDVVSALTTARDDATHAIARRFTDDEGNQEPIPEEELDSGLLIDSGFPGADAMFIDKAVFAEPFAEGHTPWYKRVEAGDVNICVEENWVLNLLKSGYAVGLDTEIKVWHAHEDGIARRWKGQELRLEDLSWHGYS
jgi:hypothetical protein